MVTENILTVGMTESDLNFNELTPMGKSQQYVLLSNQWYKNDSDKDDLNIITKTHTNIAGKKAKPPKAPRFIFPLKK